MQRQWHSSSQDIGNQSTMNQQTQPSDADWLVHKKDFLPPVRKSSLGSLTSQDSNISQPSSRRLARTLSLRSTVDDRSKSSIPRNRDYHSRNSHLFNSSELGQEGKNSFENFTASPHTQDYVPDTEESPRNRTRGDYHPPTCRSLSLLDSKDRSFSTHRGSSASDFGDYTLRSKPLDMERVLPPLPYNAGSQGRRRESGRSSSYARQRSMDMAGSPYGNHLNGSGHRFQHSSIKEEVTQDRPHHSSSLPSMVKTKEKKSSYTSKSPERVNRESKVSSNYEVDRHVPKSISSNSSISSHLNNPKFQSADNSNFIVKDGTAGFRSKHQDTSLNKNGTTRSSSESKGRSQIPSLLRFRSSSVSRDIEKQKKIDLNKNEEVSSSVRKPRLSSSSRSTPDRSILSKFFRPGSEEKEVIREVDSAGEAKDAAKKKRRISRFLRPDFFDTPREESVYAKEKDAKKAAEAESKLKLRKNLRKPVGSHSQDTTDKNVETNSVSVSSDNINTNKDGTDLKNSSKREVAETGEEKETGEQIQFTNEVKEKSNTANCDKKLEKGTPAFEKQSNNSNSKSRFLHSLEKKLEKFRSSGDDIPSASSSSGKSRVDKAIRSLREQSLTPRGGDIITSESHLLKRAVSVSDCCTVESISKNQMPLPKDNAGSKLGNKVTSVLGLFRKLEDTPVKTHQSSPPRPSVLSRLRRTQSVYAGSQSDSVLNTGADASGSSEFRPIPSLRLKKTNSNSSVKKPIEGAKTIQKESLEAGKKTETYSQNPELKMLESKTIKHTTENILGSEIALDTSNTAQENGNLATKQQESSVPKLVKRGNFKTKTKNTTESGNKIQPKNATNAKSASVLVQGKCSENHSHVKSPALNNTMSVRPHSLIGLKGVIPDNVIKTPEASNMPAVNKLDKATRINESVSLTTEEVATDVKAVCPPCENKNNDNLSKNKNDSEKRETARQDSTNHSADADKAGELESCVSSEISPSTDNAFDNSPVDDFSLNDDEIRFANVKRLDSYPYPADDCSVLSPADESESFDSWSVCSDFESREFPTSPIPPPGDDVEESVGDRIRRKSFYSRFNDIKKKHRKSSLSSIGSLSSSYRDPNSVSFLHHPRNFSRKKDHPLDYVSNSSHSAYHPLQPHRSQSLYAQNDYDDRLVPYSRRSPIPPKSEGNASPLSTENMARGMNGYADEFSSTDSHQRTSLSVDEDIQQAASTVGESVHFRGGSMEILQLPRHFNHNTNLDTVPNQHIPLYSNSLRRGSDSRLSRSTESNIGATIPKSRIPATWDRHLTLTPRFSSNNIGVAVTSHPDSAVTLGSVAGETLPVHGKYNRYNSNSPLDAPSSIYIRSPTPAGENIWMDSERPVTPH